MKFQSSAHVKQQIRSEPKEFYASGRIRTKNRKMLPFSGRATKMKNPARSVIRSAATRSVSSSSRIIQERQYPTHGASQNGSTQHSSFPAATRGTPVSFHRRHFSGEPSRHSDTETPSLGSNSKWCLSTRYPSLQILDIARDWQLIVFFFRCQKFHRNKSFHTELSSSDLNLK